MVKRFWWTGLMFGLCGCLMQNLSPETRMRDAVIELNEGARWGRMDVASGHVAPQFQPQFKASHTNWGRGIQIADTEIIGMNPQTDVRQTWQKHKQTFLLTNESIESGHPGLLIIPEAPPEAVRVDPAPQESEGFADDSQWSSVY